LRSGSRSKRSRSWPRFRSWSRRTAAKRAGRGTTHRTGRRRCAKRRGATGGRRRGRSRAKRCRTTHGGRSSKGPRRASGRGRGRTAKRSSGRGRGRSAKRSGCTAHGRSRGRARAHRRDRRKRSGAGLGRRGHGRGGRRRRGRSAHRLHHRRGKRGRSRGRDGSSRRWSGRRGWRRCGRRLRSRSASRRHHSHTADHGLGERAGLRACAARLHGPRAYRRTRNGRGRGSRRRRWGRRLCGLRFDGRDHHHGALEALRLGGTTRDGSGLQRGSARRALRSVFSVLGAAVGAEHRRESSVRSEAVCAEHPCDAPPHPRGLDPIGIPNAREPYYVYPAQGHPFDAGPRFGSRPVRPLPARASANPCIREKRQNSLELAPAKPHECAAKGALGPLLTVRARID
jgi:hypothetical protein